MLFHTPSSSPNPQIKPALNQTTLYQPLKSVKMFGWGDGQQQYDQVYNQDQGDENDGKFSHELLAGGASFAAMKVFEDQQRKEGMSQSAP